MAPTLVPVKVGDRVKTDRRDALKLARSYRSGDLTAVWVPDAAHEALRDVVRARESAQKDQLRARHRLAKFLLRQGPRPPATMHVWTQAHLTWVKTVRFEHAAQESTLLDYLQEVEHTADRIERLDRAIDDAVKTTPEPMRAVIDALQALRASVSDEVYIPRSLDKTKAADLVVEALRELGLASQYDLHVFRGGSESDWRVELRSKDARVQPFFVTIPWSDNITLVDLVAQIRREIERQHLP